MSANSMSANDISALTDQLNREISDAGAKIGNSDPEIWEHLFEDGITEGIDACPASTSAKETTAFRGLYGAVKEILDKALIPSPLVEASRVIKYQVTDALHAIAKKDPAVGAEILADFKNVYRVHSDIRLRSIARTTVRDLEALLGAAPGANVTPGASAAFDAAARQKEENDPVALAGKTVVFTGTLSITRQKAARIAESHGLQVLGGISKNTDFLVAGADPGQKLNKATALGVKVVNEKQWNALLAAGQKIEPPAPAVPTVTQAVQLLRPFRFRT